MDLLEKLFFISFLILGAAIDGAQSNTMVTGTVFCDQCKDGQRSLFDYPISGEIHMPLTTTFFICFVLLLFLGDFGDIPPYTLYSVQPSHQSWVVFEPLRARHAYI
jgi:hypothetical protein